MSGVRLSLPWRKRRLNQVLKSLLGFPYWEMGRTIAQAEETVQAKAQNQEWKFGGDDQVREHPAALGLDRVHHPRRAYGISASGASEKNGVLSGGGKWQQWGWDERVSLFRRQCLTRSHVCVTESENVSLCASQAVCLRGHDGLLLCLW